MSSVVSYIPGQQSPVESDQISSVPQVKHRSTNVDSHQKGK